MRQQDQNKVNQAIKGTALEGRLAAKDIERWQEDTTTPQDEAPLWLTVLVSMAASLNMQPEEVDGIMRAAMPEAPKAARLSKSKSVRYYTVDPTGVFRPSVDAEALLHRGDISGALENWLQAIRQALHAHMLPAEPYRLFGNLAATAFVNGEPLLAETALTIALRFNPNYRFGQNLSEQQQQGLFLRYSLEKRIDTPMKDTVVAKDLEVKRTEELFADLAKMHIAVDTKRFMAMARKVTASIEPLVDSLTKDAADCDEDYVYAAVEVLWNRLVGRPVFETIEAIRFDLEDIEPESNLYFDCLKKLSWALTEAHADALAQYGKYPAEGAELRFAVHDVLAFEVLRDSSVAGGLLRSAERLHETGDFPDMAVNDIVRRLVAGNEWHTQYERLIERNQSRAQVIAMGLTRGLLEVGRNDDAIAAGEPVWQAVVEGNIVPDIPEIDCIADYLTASYEACGDKARLRHMKKDTKIIERTVAEHAKQERAAWHEKEKEVAYNLLLQSGDYPEVFEYEAFIQSLGLDFATDELTTDTASIFSSTGEKIGRNDQCFCGSGKKYKKCHGSAV